MEMDLSIEETVGKQLKIKGLTLSTAESCTGGNLAGRITAVAGSSEYYKGGIIAYANEIKTNLLHVSPQTLDLFGAVSREVVVEMAKGAMNSIKTDCAVATSGIAGPGGGTPNKPVGTIWIAAIYENEIATLKLNTNSGRSENIKNAVEEALILLLNLIK